MCVCVCMFWEIKWVKGETEGKKECGIFKKKVYIYKYKIINIICGYSVTPSGCAEVNEPFYKKFPVIYFLEKKNFFVLCFS